MAAVEKEYKSDEYVRRSSEKVSMNKIVYIMGTGRSGTTLLDTILGNNPDIFSAGELNRFPKYFGQPLRVDEESQTAVFWNKFKSAFPDAMLKDSFRTIHRICHSFEYHSNIYKLWFGAGSQNRRIYQDYLKSFFSNLESMVDESVVVDSSKYPLRGYYLSELLPYTIAYIYIRRNPVALVKSFAKTGIEQPRQGWLSANLYMMVVNSLSIFLIRKLRRRHKIIVINYEDLVSNPVKTISDIGVSLEIDVSHSVHLAKTGGPFQKGLLFDGNRIRLENEVYLKSGLESGKPENLKDYITLFLQKFWWKQKS